MNGSSFGERYFAVPPAAHLRPPLVRLQPICAKEGKPSTDLVALGERISGVACLEPLVTVRSPRHWAETIGALGSEIDAIVPISIPCYPTEVWNSHPQPLQQRGLPVIFWPLIACDEPDFWRWSATDFLRALGVDAHLVGSNRRGLALLRALAFKRMLRDSSLLVFGEQNFPWNAPAAGHLITATYGVTIRVRAIDEYRRAAAAFDHSAVDELIATRLAPRYRIGSVSDSGLREALRVYLGIKSVLEEQRALGFGVNCFGDLIPCGGRDVPCLAQLLLREEGYIASCDGDYLAMVNMLTAAHFLWAPCMMSNMYPVGYVGALKEHFGETLSPDESRFAKHTWKNMARLGHCGWVGVISPEMTPAGTVTLNDWGGTYEIKRDGRGCGIDACLPATAPVTMLEQKFDGKTLLAATGEIIKTTRYATMPHCESAALLRFDDLEGFVADISREHVVLVFGDYIEELSVLAGVLGLDLRVYRG